MTALLATKLGVRRRSTALVARGRLLERLDAEREARLILLSAPAGFGKSCLLADWIGRSGVRVGWVSLDPADDDPTRFLRYLAAAGRSVAARAGEAAGPADDLDIDGESVVGRVIEALAGVDGRAVVVLDDYHVIRNSEIHALVERLLELLPDGSQLAIATRADPPLPLSRLRARGELLELRAEDLRFRSDEAAELLTLQLGEGLSAEGTATLARRSEGWAAVLQLAAVSLRDRADRERAVREFGASHRFVLDFVADEVLANLDPPTHAFLLETSILSRLSGPLCDAVTGRPGSAERLERLERANLLVLPLDDERRWYRYHHLFRELLRARLVIQRPSRVPELHGRAARWFEEAGDVDEAIGHAVAAEDPATAVRLVRRHWLGWLHSGETWTVQRWLDALPRSVLAADPQLCAAYAWALTLRAEKAGVAERIAEAEAALERDDVEPVDRLSVPSQLACLRANLAQLLGDAKGYLAHAREALELVPPEGTVPPVMRTLLRANATLLIAHGLRSVGRPDEAVVMYRRALPLLHAGGNVIAASHAVLNLVRLEISRGRASEALTLARTALEEPWRPAAAFEGRPDLGPDVPTAEPTAERPAMAAVHVALAEALIASAVLDAARDELGRASELGRRGEGRALVALRETEAKLDAAERRRAGPASGDGRSGRSASANARLVEPLTERELEVLRLVSTGRTNRQVAKELVVAIGTVKAHLHTASSKLGASNRLEAVARARAVGLLD